MQQCSKCGFQNEDGAVFCASCGSAMDTGTSQAPAQNDFYTPADSAQPPQPVGSNPGILWLVLNSVFTFIYLVLAFCTCITALNMVFGIIGIVFGAMGMSKFKAGRVDEARANAKTSMIMFIVGAALAVLMIIAIVVIYLVAGAAILSDLPNYRNFN